MKLKATIKRFAPWMGSLYRGALLSKDAGRYLWARYRHRPYFGRYLFSMMGNWERYPHMAQLIATESKRNPGRPLRVLELGSWAGGSALVWANALKRHAPEGSRLVCLDGWRPFNETSIDAGDKPKFYGAVDKAIGSGKVFRLFLHNIKTSRNDEIVVVMRGKSVEVLPILAPGSFDIVFIDANHRYPWVKADIENSIPLLKDDGVMSGDDLELQLHQAPESAHPEYELVDWIDASDTKPGYHPGVARAVGELFGTVSAWHGFWAARKSGASWTQVEL